MWCICFGSTWGRSLLVPDHRFERTNLECRALWATYGNGDRAEGHLSFLVVENKDLTPMPGARQYGNARHRQPSAARPGPSKSDRALQDRAMRRTASSFGNAPCLSTADGQPDLQPLTGRSHCRSATTAPTAAAMQSAAATAQIPAAASFAGPQTPKNSRKEHHENKIIQSINGVKNTGKHITGKDLAETVCQHPFGPYGGIDKLFKCKRSS